MAEVVYPDLHVFTRRAEAGRVSSCSKRTTCEKYGKKTRSRRTTNLFLESVHRLLSSGQGHDARVEHEQIDLQVVLFHSGTEELYVGEAIEVQLQCVCLYGGEGEGESKVLWEGRR